MFPTTIPLDPENINLDIVHLFQVMEEIEEQEKTIQLDQEIHDEYLEIICAQV